MVLVDASEFNSLGPKIETESLGFVKEVALLNVDLKYPKAIIFKERANLERKNSELLFARRL